MMVGGKGRQGWWNMGGQGGPLPPKCPILAMIEAAAVYNALSVRYPE